MPKYTVGRDDEVLGEFTAEQIKEQVRSGELLETDLVHTEGLDDWKPIGEVSELQNVEAYPSPLSGMPKWKKVIGYSVLFAILIFWMSEATFRPPSTDREIDRDWSGWVKVISGESEGGYTNWRDDDVLFWGTGPVYAFVRIFYDKLNLQEFAPDRKKGRQTLPPARHHPTDIIALLMWIFICSVVGSIIGFVWRKKSKKAEANGTPLNTQKYRKPIIAAAILMGLVIVAAEVRNAMRKSFRKTNYALLMAAKEGDIEAVKKYLDKGAEINVMARANGQKFEGWWSGEFNSLHTATQSNNDELVKLLIARGADVNVLADRGYNGSQGYTALSYAVSNGNVGLAEFLISKGANVNLERSPPLHSAVKAPKNREELVELLLSKGAEVNKEEDGETALYSAVNRYSAVKRTDNIEVIKVLLAKGANVNKTGHSSSAFEHALDGMKRCQKDLDRAKPGDKEKQQNRLDKMTEIVELLRKHGGKE